MVLLVEVEGEGSKGVRGVWCDGVYWSHPHMFSPPISPLIANLFMEELEVKALSTCSHPWSLWQRFHDDTFIINKAEHNHQLLQDINNQDPHIQFTVKEPLQEGTLWFLDTLVSVGPNNTFNTTAYRKPTHTDQYLHCDNNHFITAKHSVFNTLAHRAKIVSFNQEAFHKELNHIKRAFQACQFPPQALSQLQQKFENKHNNSQESNQPNNSFNTADNNSRNITIVVSYIQGIWEKFKKVCKSKGIKVKFKCTNTLETLLVQPK